MTFFKRKQDKANLDNNLTAYDSRWPFFLNVREEIDLEQGGKCYGFHSLSWQ